MRFLDAEDSLLEILVELEEHGEIALYLKKDDDGKVLSLSAVHGKAVQEVRNVLGNIHGYQARLGSEDVFFNRSEMMKLKVVK